MSVGPFGSGAFGTGVFANTPFYTTQGLIDAVLRGTGHSTPSAETAKRAVVLDFLNNRYAFVTTCQHWNWLYQEVDTLFKEPYTTGTITVEKDSQTVVGVGTAWDVNVIPNNVLAVDSRNETYLISDIEGPEEITLEGQYAGEDDSELSCKIIKPIYTLPSDCEAVQSIVIKGVGELIPVGTQEFTRLKQHNMGMTGAPRWFTEVARRAEDGVRLIEVYPAPDKHYTARLYYGVNIMKLSDSDTSYPLIPDRHRTVLYMGALADMFRYLRDAQMSADAEALFTAALMNMRNDKQLTDSRIQFQPSRNYRNRRTKGGGRSSQSTSDFAREE